MATKMYKCQIELKLPATIQTNLLLEEVNNCSSPELKELLYTFAKCFTKELGLGSAYEYSRKNDSAYQVLLFVEKEKMIGGCACHQILVGTKNEMPELQWVWLIASQRRQGLFQNLWNSFTSNLDKLAIGCLIEESMQVFIKKQINW